ncbi:DUF4153 domain-containing protein [Nevskia sp.]|uniref:DUF4153 domain-containing protein n=1 Tax=Nevskia sp. TaxID=1929292 RepID=UPI0025FAEA2A|nr:DUF4153 domain-containing protein [Nevskia sp.]
MDDAGRDARGPDRATQWLIVVIAEMAAILLLVLHEGSDRKWPGFADQGLRMLLYTLAIAPPLMLALMVERLREHFSYLAIGLLAALLAGIALHTGNACLPGSSSCVSVLNSYWLSLLVGLFVLLPFLQTWRDAGTRLPIGLPYSGLYHHAWDNALALAATAAFVGAAWAVLWLWGALFALIGIPEFRELFDKPRFVYPVTGLITGFGLVMSRAQGGALRAVLRLCLSLTRALLPFVMGLSLLFLAVVLFKGVDTLWLTRRAASLLLWLVLFGVVLANGVYQDGGAEARYPRWLRGFVSAGLVSLPAQAALAIWAISLRVDQHGWTPERLTALMVAVILGLHALLLAWAALPARDGRWLARLSVGNPLMAGVVVVLVLASQSPLLDFRAITVSSQLARLERGEVDLVGVDACIDKAAQAFVNGVETPVNSESRPCEDGRPPDKRIEQLDIHLFARELGVQGQRALEALKTDPRYSGDAKLVAEIDDALRDPSNLQPEWRTLAAADIHVLPAGTALPAGLFEALAADLKLDRSAQHLGTRSDCHRELRICVLMAIDLGGPEGLEWLFVPSEESYELPPLVYGQTADGGWQLMAWAPHRYDNARLKAAPLLNRLPTAAASRWWQLRLGREQFPIVDGRPELLDRSARPVSADP